MSTTVTGSIKVTANVNDAKASPPSVSTPVDTIELTEIFTILAGTGASKADLCYRGSLTVTAGGSTSLDLSGSLTNAFGETLTFSSIKAIIIKNKSTADSIVASFDDSNAFASACDGNITILVGGIFVLMTDTHATGYAVTAGTGDILTLDASAAGANVDVDIIILGND